MGDLILGVILQYMVSASFNWLVKGGTGICIPICVANTNLLFCMYYRNVASFPGFQLHAEKAS